MHRQLPNTESLSSSSPPVAARGEEADQHPAAPSRIAAIVGRILAIRRAMPRPSASLQQNTDEPPVEWALRLMS